MLLSISENGHLQTIYPDQMLQNVAVGQDLQSLAAGTKCRPLCVSGLDCAFAQSDQGLHGPLTESLDIYYRINQF